LVTHRRLLRPKAAPDTAVPSQAGRVKLDLACARGLPEGGLLQPDPECTCSKPRARATRDLPGQPTSAAASARRIMSAVAFAPVRISATRFPASLSRIAIAPASEAAAAGSTR
jgi:hypothetical protein